MNKIWGGILLFFIASSMQAQLVNIESIRMHTDSTRFVLKSDVLFNYSNTDGTYIYRFNLALIRNIKPKT